MKIELAKENVLKNLTAECEKVENSRGKKTYFFNIGEFVKNAMDAIERHATINRDRAIAKILENTVMQHVPDDSMQLSHRILKDFIKSLKIDCDHVCTGNCRMVGCNCEHGEWHESSEQDEIQEDTTSMEEKLEALKKLHDDPKSDILADMIK